MNLLGVIQKCPGIVKIDDKEFDNGSAIDSSLRFNNSMVILLNTNETSSESQAAESANKDVRITVRQYMTKKSTPGFDFMEKWNNDNPMPLRTMTGSILRETKGMYFMELHGDLYAERIQTCMRCGRPITNPVSQYFGMGPECGSHNYVNPFESDEELKKAVEAYKKELLNVTWKGWVIKSAIEEMIEL